MESPTASEAQAYLYRHIPISRAMGVKVEACDTSGVTLRTPIAPNINHRSTVFGGSASAVAILAAWTWLHFALRAAGMSARLVIQRNNVEYLAPITGVSKRGVRRYRRSSGINLSGRFSDMAVRERR